MKCIQPTSISPRRSSSNLLPMSFISFVRLSLKKKTKAEDDVVKREEYGEE